MRCGKKVSFAANKDTRMIEDGSNYGDFLPQDHRRPRMSLQRDELEDAWPVRSRSRRSRTSSRAGKGVLAVEARRAQARVSTLLAVGMTAGLDASSEATKFPSLYGQGLDGNDVSSDELFSKNKVTVMNFGLPPASRVGELGDLENLNKELAEKGGQVVGARTLYARWQQGRLQMPRTC